MRVLIDRGQWNFVNGGFSAPDEATTNADDILDNFMAGHRFLKEEVGIKDEQLPQVSWQLDSFGVSKGYARLAHDMGFDAMFFSRIDLQEKAKLAQENHKQQIWRPDEDNFGDQKDILSLVIT